MLEKDFTPLSQTIRSCIVRCLKASIVTISVFRILIILKGAQLANCNRDFRCHRWITLTRQSTRETVVFFLFKGTVLLD